MIKVKTLVCINVCMYIFNITASTHGRESTHSRAVVGSYSPTYTHYVSVNLMSKNLENLNQHWQSKLRRPVEVKSDPLEDLQL